MGRDFSEVIDIIESFGFEFVCEPDMMWRRYILNNLDNGFLLEVKFDHVCLYHIYDNGEKVCDEPFQFILTEPNDLKIILKTLVDPSS